MALTLSIPNNVLSDFLGTIALDILHDSKNNCYGQLQGNKLYKITDLMAYGLYMLNSVDIEWCNNFVFQAVVQYFYKLWYENLECLGITKNTDMSDISKLRDTILVPISSSDTHDYFARLGKNRTNIESENYHYQLALLKKENIGFHITFSSPCSDFFTKAMDTVQQISSKLPNGRIVLDMKSSAGLLRTITDPIGYTTGLPTCADPGYNMPGMSAIRKNSTNIFSGIQEQFKYTGPFYFGYRVKLETSMGNPLDFLNVKYFYGAGSDGISMSNIITSMFGESLVGTLPRSLALAYNLKAYLLSEPHTLSFTGSEIIDMIYGYFESQISPTITGHIPPEFNSWISSGSVEYQSLKANYVTKTVRNAIHFGSNIKNLLPLKLLKKFRKSSNIGFRYHQLCLIREFSKSCGLFDKNLHFKLEKMLVRLTIETKYRSYLKELVATYSSADYVSRVLDTDIQHLDDFYNGKLVAIDCPKIRSKILRKYAYMTKPGFDSKSDIIQSMCALKLYTKGDLLSKIITKSVQSDPETLRHNAAIAAFGKFSGDFGQIMWSIKYGHFFASEDNNASAMALLLQRLNLHKNWGAIHGLGDGSRVDISVVVNA